jgi:outer membrane protein TolC
MRDRRLPLVLFFAVCGLASGAAAQDVPVLRLTLDEAQMRAREASHRLAEAQARESVAQATVTVREAADRPVIAALGGFTRTNHVLPFTVPSARGVPLAIYPDVPSNYHSRLDLQWPVCDGGRTDALERAARADAAAAASDVAVAQADLRLEVARAFWAVVTARAAVDVLDQGVARSQANVADVRQRFMAGLVPPNEVASAEAQESRARMLAIEARNQRFDSVLAVEVRQRALDVESGRAAVAAAGDAVRAAAEARRVVRERYQAGVITQIEVLDAEYALLQAELDRTRALAGVRLSDARLGRAIGR